MMSDIKRYEAQAFLRFGEEADGDWMMAMDVEKGFEARDQRIQLLERQIQILWEIGSNNITPEHLENARKGLLL
jgi:hypothetical protein